MQQKVRVFNDNMPCHNKQMPTYARILDTQSELGELAKEYLKSTSYGTKKFQIENNFKMEYGDVLYCLLSLANELNIDADECLDLAIEKYKKRIVEKKSMGSGR